MSTGSVKCLQIFVSLLCIIQLILGLAFIIVSATSYQSVNPAGESVKKAAIFPIVVGCIIVAVALFGLCGAIIKNTCLLITFCIFISLSLLLCIICLIVAFALLQPTKDFVKTLYDGFIQNYDTDEASKNAMDATQISLTCCGYTSVDDWKHNANYTKGNLPLSCCLNGTLPADCTTSHKDKYYPKTCQEVMESFISMFLNGFGIVAIIATICLFLALLLAAILTSKIRKEYNPV